MNTLLVFGWLKEEKYNVVAEFREVYWLDSDITSSFSQLLAKGLERVFSTFFSVQNNFGKWYPVEWGGQMSLVLMASVLGTTDAGSHCLKNMVHVLGMAQTVFNKSMSDRSASEKPEILHCSGLCCICSVVELQFWSGLHSIWCCTSSGHNPSSKLNVTVVSIFLFVP